MERRFRSALHVVAIVAIAVSVGVTYAQTPAQMEYERQQREAWRQQEQQRQEQQRQQQIMQDNARRQQEESSRINAPASQGQAAGGQGGASGAQGRGGDQAAAALSAARAKWEKQPPLPAERNPLLGRWARPASTRPNSSDPFGAIQALAKGGLCEALFGGSVFEFRPDKLVGMDERTREQELDRVEYRGDAKHVVVLPKTTFKLMEFDFDGPDRISWTGQNCKLVRVAATPSASGARNAAIASAAPSSAMHTTPNSGGVLSLSVGAPADGKVAGRKLWVLKEDAQVALIKGGLKSTPAGSALQIWMRACQSRAPDCATGAKALQAYTIGIATTDASGHAETPALPAGRYWVLADAKVGAKHVMWNQPVDVKDGGKSLTLDQRNAMSVD